MNLDFYVSIAVSAGAGTAIVEIILKLFLSHFLEKQMYRYKLNSADKRECAEKILGLISSESYLSWSDKSNAIYTNAYDLSERLITIGQKEASDSLYKFIQVQKEAQVVLSNMFKANNNNNDLAKIFLNSQHEIEKARTELVNICTKMNK